MLAYAQELKLKPVLTIMSYSRGPENLQKKSRERFDLAETYCASNGVRLLILFPTQPKEPHKIKSSSKDIGDTVRHEN